MSYNSGLTIFILLTGLILCPFAAALDSPDEKNNIILPGSENHEEPGIIPVGILLPQSGFISDIGKEYEDAFGIASNEYPGSVLMPVLMDAGSDSKTSVAAWNKMKTEYPNLSIIITIASWTTNAIYPEAAKDGILHIALGSAVVSQNNDSDRLVRFTPGVEQESPVLAKFLKQYDRVLILGSDNDYSNGYIKALESIIPEKIAGIVKYDPDRLEESLDTEAISENNPDIILLLSVTEGGKVIGIIREHGISVPLLGTRVIERNTLLDEPAAEGLIFTTPALDRSHPFFNQYLEQFGEEATFYGAEGYDAMMNLYKAADACKDDTGCLSSWFTNYSYNGTLGEVKLDENRVAFYPIEFRVIRDGKFEPFDQTANS